MRPPRPKNIIFAAVVGERASLKCCDHKDERRRAGRVKVFADVFGNSNGSGVSWQVTWYFTTSNEVGG